MIASIIIYLSILLVSIENSKSSGPAREVQCRDPDAGGTMSRNKDRKFMIIGTHEGTESSGLGEVCSIITCGFPFVKELSNAFPDILTPDKIRHAPVVKAVDFGNYVDNKREIDDSVVRAGGYMPASEWWMYFNTTAHCVKKITGCDLGDVACADRHAFQRLIRGPFKTSLTEKEEKRIHGVPDHIKHAILTLPHAYAPRLDAAVHIRAQFHHFEKNTDANDPEYKKEVSNWLNSTEASTVFSSLESKLIAVIKDGREAALLKKANNTPSSSLVNSNTSSNIDPVYVYLASDNEEVKDHFAGILERRPIENDLFKINIMRVDAQAIHHVKDLAKMKKATNNEGLLDLVFDWYALSLANLIFAWRKGSTHMVSTFVHSAQRVSGTTERTDSYAPPGHGIGTKGYQLMKDRRGNPKWDLMWTYSFLEEYKIKI